MTINISEETLQVIISALYCARTDLKMSLRKKPDNEITKHQLKKVNEVIDMFEEEM